MNKKSQANVSSINLDSFYMLTKDTNGVQAKFIGAPWMSSKKKAIWVLKSLVTNLRGLLAFLSTTTKNRINPTLNNDTRNGMVIFNLSLLQ
jgi:hypothetical protein